MTDTLNENEEVRTGYPTPETDAVLKQYEHHLPNWLASEIMAAVARRLERERNEWKEVANGNLLGLIKERDEWKAEAERWRSLAQAWKEEAVEQIKEASRLVEGIRAELRNNAHLADGDDCTLIGLKRLIGYEEDDL